MEILSALCLVDSANSIKLTDHEMNVGWPHWMSVESGQELIGWSICGKRVCSRSKAVQAVFAVLVCLELSAQVVVALVLWILEVVFAVAASLPNVKCDVWNRLLGLQVFDCAMHVRNSAYTSSVEVLRARWSSRYTSTYPHACPGRSNRPTSSMGH